MRLDKYLAESGVGLRKGVRELIKQGKVTVNSEIILEAAYEVEIGCDLVQFEGKQILHSGKRYIMFHKPAGCITARSDERHKTVLDYFEEEEKLGLFPVGRLDKDTEGLLLLTNDGEFDYQLMNPKHHVQKTYYFIALGEISEEEADQLRNGVCIEKEGGLTKPAEIVVEKSGFCDEFLEYPSIREEVKKDRKTFTSDNDCEGNPVYRKPVVMGRITITEGKKHQVKRMLRAVGCFVIYLKRLSIGDLKLDENLAMGEYRYLTEEEMQLLQKDQNE